MPEINAAQLALAAELRRDVEGLAIGIGARNVWNVEGYRAAESLLARELAATGRAVQRQVFAAAGVECVNFWIEVPGTKRPEEIVVVGAHYDSVDLPGTCPAANDNGSGCAAVLAMARRLAGMAMERTVRFVFFANEEPPFFFTEDMGSLVYANECKRRGDNIVAMITPETIGCYSEEPGSQWYPLPLGGILGDRADFIAFVGLSSAGKLVKQCVGVFREASWVTCMGAAMPGSVPMVGASDHWGFWRNGYPALMVTDTALYRYPFYHTPQDTPEKLNYEMMARVVEGFWVVVARLATV